LDVPFDIKKLEKEIKFKVSLKQKFIEYSPLTLRYLKDITNKINLNNGGILIIDYGYLDKEMKNTIQAVSKHKYTNILNSFRNSDITYNLSFNLISQIIKKMGPFLQMTTTQKEFLTKLGILKRAEILSRNMQFSKKADMYFRIKRLIDEKQMGNLFKVVFITNKKNKFKLGF
jgi:cyclopropane-fatty-acyl-phospholipid synthase